MRALVVTIVLCHAAAVRADVAEDTALQHLDKGIAAYRLADYDTAHRELDLAHELAPDRPNPYRWLALTEAAQKNCKDALANIESFLSRVPTGDPRVAEMTELRTKCLQTISLRAPEPAPVPTPPTPIPAIAPVEEPPVYKRWWLWTAVGAAVISAVGVTYVVTRPHDTMLPPITCDGNGCR